MPFAVFKVKDRSMEPTIKDGSYVLVSWLGYYIWNPKVGDIVVLRHPYRKILLLKRVTKVTSKGYFVTGDNKKNSEDSRRFGPVGKDRIIGKVISVFSK